MSARLGDFLVYAAVRLLETTLLSLPPEAALACSRGAGTLWWLADARRRRRVRENLLVAFPRGFAGGVPARAVRTVFQNMIRVPLEAMWGPRLLATPAAVRRRCRLLGDWDLALEESAEGRGGVVATGHLGNWEVACRVVSSVLPRARFVVRPIDNPFVDRHTVRARGGERAMIRKRGAVREILRALEAGAWTAILTDQDAGPHGRFVPFFGLEASTRATAAVVAVRKGVSLYAGACVRRPGLLRFDVHLARLDPPAAGPEGPEGAGTEADRSDALLRALTGRLETWIRATPDQYNWLHRRWKTRPPHEPAETLRPVYSRLEALH